MPTYIRPARVDTTECGTGGLVPVVLGVVAAAAVVAFIVVHLELLAVCAGIWLGVMGCVAAWFRWAASPRRLQAHLQRPVVRALPRSAAQAFPEPRRRAVGPPRVIPAQVTIRTGGERLRP